MNSMKMDLLKNKDAEPTDTAVILEDEYEGSISSEEDGAGVDCIARSRLRPLKDIWPAEAVLSCLRQIDVWDIEQQIVAEAVHLPEQLVTTGMENLSEQLAVKIGGEEALPVALLWACWLGKPAVLRAVLEAGVSANVQDPCGRSGLHLASLTGNAECVMLLLERGANPNCWDGAHRSTPIHCAANTKSLPCIQALIKFGADVNAGINDRSPLHYAVHSEAVDCVKVLLENGARADTPQVFTETPLHVAAALGNAACTRLLLRHGADACARLGTGRLTALHLAAEDGYLHCARELLDKGATLDMPNNRYQTALHLACIAQALDTVEFLLSRGASTSTGDLDGRTPLHAALGRSARGGECARALLVAGADPNVPDNYGYTPVHLAALNEFSSSVKMLLDYGGDVTMKTKGGHSALSFIVRRTPEVLPYYIKKFDDSIKVADHEIGDVDCELKLDFRSLVPLAERFGGIESKTRGESNLLLSFVEVGRKDVLKHPLCETFLYLKWKRIRKFFFASLVYHTIFVICFSIYIMGIQMFHINNSKIPVRLIIVGYLLICLNILLLSKEVLQLMHQPGVYLKHSENWLQLLIMLSVFLCTIPGLAEGESSSKAVWQQHVAAVGIFLAWVELMLIVGRFPMFGLYIQMFTTVAINFGKFLMAYSCLLIAFALCFGILFANYPSFSNIYFSLLKTVIMMSGELEFEDVFYATDSPIQYPVTAHIIFLAFVVLVTVILTNLLVGLAVSDIQALQESACLDRLVRQAGQVARLEALLFSPLLRWVPQHFLTVLHRGALLLSDPYKWALIIRPNDPRENRIPKSLISAIYKLVAERKEQAKTVKRDKQYGMNRMSVNKSFYLQSVKKQHSSVRQRTVSDISNDTFKNQSSSPTRKQGEFFKQVDDLFAKMDEIQKIVETKLTALETRLDAENTKKIQVNE